MHLSRRSFLLGVSTTALSAALPGNAGPIVGIDLASGPDRTALWIIESTPAGDSWVRHLYERNCQILQQQIANAIYENSHGTPSFCVAFEPTEK